MSMSEVDWARRAVPGVQALAPYEPGKPIAELRREYGVTDIIKLASNESPLGPSPQALTAAREAAAEVHRYPDGNAFELKARLAARHGVGAERITLGNGSNDVLALIAQAFLGPEREAVFSRHAFAVYPIVTQAAGAVARVAPAHGADSDQPYGHDLAAMQRLISGRTRVVFIANPNNPTGTWVGEDALRAFIEQVPGDVLVVVDEAYFEYARDLAGLPDASRWLDEFPNLVVTRTFSKCYGLAGLRVGYALSSPPVAELLNRVRQPFNCNAVAQAAAGAALDDEAHLARAIALNTEQLRLMEAELRQLGLTVLPSAGNFLCFDVGGGAASVNEGLLRAGVIVRPVGGYELPGFLRVSVGLPEENRRFLDTLERLISAPA
ncbi:histidinol-phosphate transaminase [Alkalilimnicola ehrlichii MLHE-1]|uniref:Histidinol-phosphate aminotransferase n=1 Tax=Alkalilimnicola ehrlichii (strain ATCC BAA-1101 / DSM 17681 / MLHE-1) TaxID=187272 RepID=Q0AA56_ALKEH|nr:histidinol-phosphate transaminase [Alkalilimnicola ehrlichii]ABI56281.1 aminotransferase [Alkalilimnicola ehrlichii MLHE-1]